jgi:hypothetical protein
MLEGHLWSVPELPHVRMKKKPACFAEREGENKVN